MSLIVDIKKRLGSFSLSAQLEAGEGVTGILGSSGCGKSMTLKCIAGIERPDSGHIELDGEVLYDSRKRIDLHPQQRRVGYLFQNYALFPNMTLRQNILCGLRNQPDKAQRVKEADDMIALMGLQGLEKHRPYQLSGGQQQRAALGRILVNKPRLLMLDEPFSALDTYLRERLQAEMRELLKSYGGPVLLVTHSRDEAYRLCRSIAVMDKGSTTPPRPTKELFEDPHTVAAASQTAYDCEHRINAHAQWNHDSGCYTTQATGSCANLAQESNSQQVAGDVFVNCFNQEGSNCCVCHTGHRLAALWELQAKDGKNSQGEEQQTHSRNNCHHRS